GQRTAVTETDGRYLITTLPSGTYALKFELQGFQPFIRQNIVVTQGSTLTVDATLEVASLSESITVTGDSPMVDTTTTKVGATFSGEALVGVPSSTDLWATSRRHRVCACRGMTSVDRTRVSRRATTRSGSAARTR